MKNKDTNERKDKKMTRRDFLKIGFAFVVGGVATSFLGCRQAAQHTNAPMPQYINFLGDPSSRVYHTLDCKLAPSRSKAVFFDSPTAAERAGFRPCAVCKPGQIK